MKLLFSIIAVFTMALGFSKDYNSSVRYGEAYLKTINHAEPCSLRIKLHLLITGTLNVRPECKILGVSCLKIERGKEVPSFDPSYEESGSTLLEFDLISEKLLSIRFLKNDIKDLFLTVEQKVDLPFYICKAFGKNNISILPGKYSVNQYDNISLSSKLNVTSN